MYEPIGRLTPVTVNHDMNVWGTTGVVTGMDGSYLRHAIHIGVPTTTKPGLHAVESIGHVCTVLASCIG